MWDQPYLETCCRAALHRLKLAGEAGRPEGTRDSACLTRLAGMDFAAKVADGRWRITEAGLRRHLQEIGRHA